MHITTLAQLRALYAAPKERAVNKQLASLDVHCQHFIALSPFVVVASSAAVGDMDASPRGGAPGFTRCVDEKSLLLPDAPGNNRLDSLEIIVATARVGLLFMVPAVDETPRVNGRGCRRPCRCALLIRRASARLERAYPAAAAGRDGHQFPPGRRSGSHGRGGGTARRQPSAPGDTGKTSGLCPAQSPFTRGAQPFRGIAPSPSCRHG